MKYTKIDTLYNDLVDNYTWFDRHPDKNIIKKYCHEIAKLFLKNKKYTTIDVPEPVSVTLLEWHTSTPELFVSRKESTNVLPEVNWDKINNTEDDKHLLSKAFEQQIKGINKEKMFNYYPLKTASDYEIHMIKEMLDDNCIFENCYEFYYNGFTGANRYVDGGYIELEKFQILTDVGIYTPDFLLLKINNKIIEKILIIETKSEVLEDEEGFREREDFVKNHFLQDKENKKVFDYIRVGDVKEDKESYNSLKDKIKKFFK